MALSSPPLYAGVRNFDARTAQYAFRLAEMFVRRLDPISRHFEKLPTPSAGEIIKTPELIQQLSVTNPEDFARRFFFKNLVKCAITIVHYERFLNRYRTITDLGSGPGTFLFPFRLHFKPANFLALDHSEDALSLACQLFDLASLKRPLAVRAHIPDCLVNCRDLMTASYLLTELNDGEFDEFCQIVMAQADAAFLIVDYPDVIDRFSTTVAEKRLVLTDTFSVRLPASLAELIGDDHVSFSSSYVTSSKDH